MADTYINQLEREMIKKGEKASKVMAGDRSEEPSHREANIGKLVTCKRKSRSWHKLVSNDATISLHALWTCLLLTHLPASVHISSHVRQEREKESAA